MEIMEDYAGLVEDESVRTGILTMLRDEHQRT